MISQQSLFITGVGEGLLEQHSFSCTRDNFTFPLFRQTILLAVNPKLEIKKVNAKKSAVIF